MYKLTQFEPIDPYETKSKYVYEALYLGGKILRSTSLAGLSEALGFPSTWLHASNIRREVYHDNTGEIVMLRRLENTPGKAPVASPKRQRAKAYSSVDAP